MKNVKIYFKNLIIAFIIVVPSYLMFRYVFGVIELQTSDMLIPFMCTNMLLNYLIFFQNKDKG